MPPKQKTPAPIDRPLSRAYLREFGGWSTAYPPGLSDPTSLRIMENILINRDGSARIRPGLRQLLRLPGGDPFGPQPMVGTHEAFYLNDGRKAYLFAVREDILTWGSTETVTFRVAIEKPPGDYTLEVVDLTTAGFNLDAWATGPFFTEETTYVKYVQIDNKILALSNAGEPFIVFHVGAVKEVPLVSELAWPIYQQVLVPGGALTATTIPTKAWIAGAQTTTPPAASWPQPTSLRSDNPALNIYNHGFFFTLSNEIGETEPSTPTVFQYQRPLGAWSSGGVAAVGAVDDYPTPDVATASDPTKSADQVIVWPFADPALFDAAVAAGARSFNVYAFVWSNQDSVPVEAQLVAQRELPPAATYATHGWVQITPSSVPMGHALPLPTPDNVLNSTGPSRAAQGLVAADRLVLVNDPTDAAVVRWSGNQQGDYLNFAPSRGGGYKTLTSGNMQVPACAKLWQNPQSADTLTILNRGTDSYSTAYYMAPASVTSQSDNTSIMGFEETTATPGTTSPFGCEVANNTLYHPLDDQLMKSTASNYNINHKSMTDLIANMWAPLRNKNKIVSCVHDQRIYYIVDNPSGVEVPEHCMGNEIWVLDLAAEGGSWSRWLVPAITFRRIEAEGRVMLSVVLADGIYAFDDTLKVDQYVDAETVLERPIPWALETNTQGANRAHDAWSHLQQANITVGNFLGTMQYGVRGLDRHGRMIEKKKILKDANAAGDLPWDLTDMLLIKADLMEWRFFASSVEVDSVVQHSEGQLNLVQYRYTPISVNIGFEFGSVETFQYGRDTQAFATGNTINAVPMPMVDTSRP